MSSTQYPVIDTQQLEEFCHRRHIRKLSLFGSVLREDFNPKSDIDVLVEFDPSHIPGFFSLWEIEQELKSIFQVNNIDLVTRGFLNPLIKERVLAEETMIYARA